MNPPATIAPFPTASGAIGCNETVSVGDVDEHHGQGFVYAGAIAFSAGAPDMQFGHLLVEEPIDYTFALKVLRHARPAEERDFPVGGPFGV